MKRLLLLCGFAFANQESLQSLNTVFEAEFDKNTKVVNDTKWWGMDLLFAGSTLMPYSSKEYSARICIVPTFIFWDCFSVRFNFLTYKDFLSALGQSDSQDFNMQVVPSLHLDFRHLIDKYIFSSMLLPFCSAGVTVNWCKGLYLYKFSKKSEGKNKFYLYQSDKEAGWLLFDISFGYNLFNRSVFWVAKLLLPSQMHSNSVFQFVVTLGMEYFVYPRFNSYIKGKEEEVWYKGGWVTKNFNIFSALFLTSSWHYYQSQAGFALNKDAAFSYSAGIFTTSYNTQIYKMV